MGASEEPEKAAQPGQTAQDRHDTEAGQQLGCVLAMFAAAAWGFCAFLIFARDGAPAGFLLGSAAVTGLTVVAYAMPLRVMRLIVGKPQPARAPRPPAKPLRPGDPPPIEEDDPWAGALEKEISRLPRQQQVQVGVGMMVTAAVGVALLLSGVLPLSSAVAYRVLLPLAGGLGVSGLIVWYRTV